MSIYTVDYLQLAHKKSIFHQKDILNGKTCSCFHCLANFSPFEISEWTDVDYTRGETALCPKCGIDAVLGALSGYPIDDKEFLMAMNNYFFADDDG